MKRLMTTLLVVLLGWTGLCFAEGVTVSGEVRIAGSTDAVQGWSNYTLTLTPQSGDPIISTNAIEVKQESDGSSTYRSYYTLANVPAGTYTLTFEGQWYDQSASALKNYEYTKTGITVGADNVTENIEAIANSKISMKVVVAHAPYGWYSSKTYIVGASVTCTEEGQNTGETKLTEGEWSGSATFTVDATKKYTVKVVAEGYRDTTTPLFTPVAELDIPVNEISVTVMGTVKLGETALSELPAGVESLSLYAGGNHTNITLNANGEYTASGIKVGEVKVVASDNLSKAEEIGYRKLSENYSVTTPANGTFTAEDNESRTVTQNIVLTKIGARISGEGANISDGELTLTKGDATEPAYTCVTSGDKFFFNGVQAGTYKVGLKKTGYVLDGEIADITVNENLADFSLGTVNIKAVDMELSFTGNLGIEGADVKLYAYTQGSNGWVIGEDALATTTSGSDGTYTLKVTGKLGSYYVVKATHASLIPFESYPIAASSATNSVYGTVNMLWVSGEITYSGDLTDGKVVLKIGEYDKPEAKVEYKDGKYVYYLGKSSLPVAGTYELSFTGRDDAAYLAHKAEVIIATAGTPVTHNFTVTKDANKGYMRIWLKYHNGDKEIEPTSLPNYSYMYKVTTDGEEQENYFYWDQNGRAEYLVEKGTSYNLHLGSTNAYEDSVYKNIAGFNGDEPNRVVLYLKGKELPLVKVSGTVTGTITGMGSDVTVSMLTPRDKKLITANITAGKYEFTDVPADRSYVTLFLTEADAKYVSDLGVSIPYNYALTSASKSAYLSDNDDHTVTQDIVVEKIASNVSGSVTGYASGFQGGEVTLTKKGATEPDQTYGYQRVMPGGQYTFRGVPAGTYTVNFDIAGYEAATNPEVTVTLEADATVPAVTLTIKDMTVKLAGNLSTSNPNTYEYEYFDGAKIEVWGWAWDNDQFTEGHETEKLAETTLPANNSYGNIPDDVTFTAKMGQSVVVKMTHPSIKPLSKRLAIEGSTLNIGPSNLPYEWVGSSITLPKMTDFNAAWNDAHDSLLLSWAWPEELKNTEEYQISRVSIARKLASESGAGTVLRHWEPTAPATFFAYEALPVAFKDTVKEDVEYAYIFEIAYEKPIAKRMTTDPYIADMRAGAQYTITLAANNEAWGKVEGAGKFDAGEEIEIKAIANEGYKFVAWMEGEEEVSTEANYTFKVEKDRTLTAVFEDATTTYYTVTLQANNAEWGKVEGADKYAAGSNATVKATANEGYHFVAWMEGETKVSEEANYTFKVEKDITLTAVFAEGTANEELEAALWTVYAENGTIVIKGLNGDRYSVYDLNGRLAGQALGTGAEIRIDVAPNKLYIVRRVSAAGLFGAKKIVVR